MADAKVTVGADASAAERAAAVVKAAWKDAGAAITSSIGSAASSVINDLANVATAAGKVNFSSQREQVKEFEGSTARMATSADRDLEQFRSGLERTGKEIGKKPGEVAAWTSEVGKLTHSYVGAGEALKGISGLAALTGRGVDEYKGLAATLGTVGHVAGDTTHAIGVLTAQADAMGVRGGIDAFAGQVEALQDVIGRFAVKSEADLLKVTGAAAMLGRGLGGAAAQRVQQQALGAVANDPLRWERFLGHSITDEHGQVADPAQVLKEITEKTKKRYGKQARRVLELNFGAETGAALFGADFNAATAAGALPPSSRAADAQKKFLATDAGQRGVAEAELATSARSLLGSSTLLGKAADSLQKFSASSPIIGTLIATATGNTLSTFMSRFGTTLSTLMGGKGNGGAVGGALDVVGKGNGGAGAALGKAGLVAAAALGGYEAGTALDEWLHISDRAVGVGGHGGARSIEEDNAQADVVSNRTLAMRRLMQQRANAALHGVDLQGAERGAAVNATQRVIQANSALAGGGAPLVAALVAELRKSGKDQVDADRIAKAVELGFKNVKLTVSNASATPVEVAAHGAKSAAAGSQK
jgi:hypothetical protein